MNQTVRTVTGIVFFILAIAAISVIHINPYTSTPTRSTETRRAGMMEGMVKGVIITQEFTAIKDYLSGIDLVFTQGGRANSNENSLLLLDADFKILHRENFSSTMVKEVALTPFRFDQPIFIGKGKLVHLCIFSNDGTRENSVNPVYNESDSIGPLYVSGVSGDELASSVKNKIRRYRGSLMLRTYGTDSSQFWFIKVVLGILSLVISILVIWFSQLKSFLAKTRIVPEWIFLVISVPVATAFALITPPLQVPDEGSHFYKSYEIAELAMFNPEKTSPVSMIKLDSAFGHLHFLAGEKTSLAEIRRHFGDRLDPGNRAPISRPAYAIPYLPQALGIALGKMAGASPLMLMYLGRLFNLIISVLIMFFAIRIIPEFKWIFLLLALMPKTLFLFGSLSYDSLTISLSFFTIAVIFHYAFACERKIGIKDLALIGFLILLLLLCKPPYFIIGLLFFFIPRDKFGKLYKYLMISAGAVILALVIYKTGPSALSYFSGNNSGQEVKAEDQAPSGAPLPVIRPDDQIRLIKSDLPAYTSLILKSGFVYYRSYILESFVGVLGWIDVELPDILTYSWLILILMAALLLSGEKVKLGLSKKALLSVLLVITFAIVETAMYIYATRPGRDRVFGVQGRYFIPMAPLFFMLFYNRFLHPLLNLSFSPRRLEYQKAKPKTKPAILQEITQQEQLFDKALYIFLICFCLFTLIYSIYITLIRYYNL